MKKLILSCTIFVPLRADGSDVKPRDLISFDIDLGQMGVGGDDSWGKRTLQKYSLNQDSYSYGFSISLFKPDKE